MKLVNGVTLALVALGSITAIAEGTEKNIYIENSDASIVVAESIKQCIPFDGIPYAGGWIKYWCMIDGRWTGQSSFNPRMCCDE